MHVFPVVYHVPQVAAVVAAVAAADGTQHGGGGGSGTGAQPQVRRTCVFFFRYHYCRGASSLRKSN